MTASLSRRSWLGRLVAVVLAWAGQRPAAHAATAAGCPHPVHQPLCAARPGRGLWFRTRLRLACPLCAAVVRHDGYLPDTAYADSRAVLPPGLAAPCDSAGLIATYTYDASRPGGLGPWQPGAVTTFTYYAASAGPDAAADGGPPAGPDAPG